MENILQKDISHLDDIKLMVNTFYGKVREDEMIGYIFNDHIKDRWPEHLEKMYKFWQTVLLGDHTYFGAPFPPHAKLPIEHKHFQRWLQLFHSTIDELFTGEKAEEAKWRGNKMAQIFEVKIEMTRSSDFKLLL